MRYYYADSSALLKRHVNGSGSKWLRRIVVPSSGNLILTSQLSLIEIYSALNRRVREASVSQSAYSRITRRIEARWKSQYEIIVFSDVAEKEAKRLLESYPLRAYDAVQLASAIIARDALRKYGSRNMIFLAADNRLLTVAQAENFSTANPNDHP
jgi:predicted nucleic acid-binding protein